MDPVGVADQYVGPATRSTERALGHRQVVAHELELGDAGLREVDLARVGDRDLAPGDLDHDPFALARHPTSIRRPLDTFRSQAKPAIAPATPRAMDSAGTAGYIDS